MYFNKTFWGLKYIYSTTVLNWFKNLFNNNVSKGSFECHPWGPYFFNFSGIFDHTILNSFRFLEDFDRIPQSDKRFDQNISKGQALKPEGQRNGYHSLKQTSTLILYYMVLFKPF